MARFKNPLFCAIDTGDLDHALQLADRLKNVVGGFKIGLQFFCAHGPQGVEKLARYDAPLFSDLKFHDIPNTVAGAVKSAMRLGPAILTVHAAGGEDMLKSAMHTAINEAAHLGMKSPPWIVAVTVLTSLDEKDLDSFGMQGSTHKVVARLARLAEKSGLDGVVCAPHEMSTIHSIAGHDMKLVVPGIRPKDSASDDQKRFMTPKEAVDAGAHVIVVGRPITRAEDPAIAARNILDSITDI